MGGYFYWSCWADSKIFSAEDPFQNKEYQKKAASPAETVREVQKTAPQADSSVRKL